MTASDPTRPDEQRRKEKTADTSAAKRKPESALSRISKRLKKRSEFYLFPDLPDNEQIVTSPPRIEGYIYLRGCKSHLLLNRTKRFFAKLSMGVLKLYKGKNTRSSVDTLSHEFKIDLSQISVGYNDEDVRFVMAFKQESHQLFPVEKESYPQWKSALQAHRWYRQYQLKQGMLNNSDASLRLNTNVLPAKHEKAPTEKSGQSVDDKVDEKTPDVSANDPLSKALDEIRATRANVGDALEKMVKLHDEMKVMYSRTEGIFDDIKAIVSSTSSQSLCPTPANAQAALAVPPQNPLQNNTSVMSTCVQPNSTAVTSFASCTSVCEAMEMSESGGSDSDSEEEDVAALADPASISTRSLEATRNRKRGKPSSKKDAALAQIVEQNPPPSQPTQLPKYELIRAASGQPTDSAKPQPQPLPASTSVQKLPSVPAKSALDTSAPPPPKKPSTLCVVQKAKPSSYQPHPRNHRTALPCEQLKGEGISYSSLATLAFRGGLPINTYEPLGTLQILCEEVRFASTLLSKATMSSDPIDRMCHVVAFAVTTYTSTCGRNRKPFNPLLGETFDYTADEGWRYHGEQVSHHPPISAGYADGPGWEWWQTFTGQPKTGWKNVELTPELPVRLRLNGNEDYTWNKVKSIVINATAPPEKRIIRHEGTMNIRCSNGVNARIEFKCDKNGLSGTVTGPMGQVKISGSWDRAVYKHGVEGRECIFEAPPPLPNASRYYGFNRFSMTLNEMFPEEMAALPPTDSRFRPDQRHLENGDAQKGTAAKQVVEQNQRSRARLPHRQLWFSKTTDSFTNCDLWVSQGKYWQAKEEGFRDAVAAMVKIFAM